MVVVGLNTFGIHYSLKFYVYFCSTILYDPINGREHRFTFIVILKKNLNRHLNLHISHLHFSIERDKQHEAEKRALCLELESERQSRQKLLSSQYELQERLDCMQR